MSTEIYLKTGELSSRTLRKAINETEAAYKKTEKAVDEALMYFSYTIDGNVCYLFPADATNQLLSASSKLKNALNKLNSLKTILDSGPEALAEIDSGKKNDLTNWWQRTTYSVGVGVAAGTAWIKSLFISNGGKTGGETVVSSTTDGSGYENQEPSAEKSEYDQYREKVEKINEAVPKGEIQHYQDARGNTYEYKTSESDVGQCTWVAATTLIQRKRASDGESTSVTCDDLLAHGGGFGTGRAFTVEGTTYQLQGAPGPYNEEMIVELLNEHPEGIAIFSKGHAIVITDYEIDRSTGAIQFYADDGVNNNPSCNTPGEGRMKIEETSLYTCNSGSIENLDFIYYIGDVR